MEKYIENELKELFDEKSDYFSKIVDILKNPNPDNKDYVELHHIIPKSLNKSLKNDKNNIIPLSSYNHTMIHYYYYKCAKTNELKIKTRPMFIIITRKNSKVRKLDSWTDKEIENIAKAIEDVKENLITLNRPFICLETNKIYKSRLLCFYELNAKNVNKVLRNEISQCNGYHFIYSDDERLKTMSNEDIINEIKQIAKKKSDFNKTKRKELYTDEWKDKISKAHNGKEFVCLETNETFTNQVECSNKYNICKSDLCNMLNKHQYYRTSNFHFIYVDEKGNKTNEECLNEINEYVLEKNGQLNKYNAKRVICYETNVIYKSASDAVKQTNIKGIARTCLHYATCAGGYHWFFVDEDIDREKYVKEHPLIYINNKVVCLETKKIYNSVEEVAKEFKVSKGAIISVCNHKTISCAKYHFLYEREYLIKTEYEIQTILSKTSKDTQKEMKALYNKMISEGSWNKENDGWKRFQKYYKENIA